MLPAPTQILARRLRRFTAQGQPIFLTGRVMGGGAVDPAVRRHLAQGLPVYATPQAALTFSDRLEAVEGWGVILTESPPPGSRDPDPGGCGPGGPGAGCWRPSRSRFPAILRWRCRTTAFPPRTATAVSASSIGKIFWRGEGNSGDLAFRQPPSHFTRMRAVAEALPGAVLMDTCAAGVRGALLDPQARDHLDHGLTVVNLGNAHTFAALVRGDRLWGIYEHHTGLLNPAKLIRSLRADFKRGSSPTTKSLPTRGMAAPMPRIHPAEAPFALRSSPAPGAAWPGAGPGSSRRPWAT